MVVRDPLESMLDDKTTSTWFPRNTFGLPVRTYDDIGYWEQSFEEVHEPAPEPPPPAPRFAPEQPTLRRWPAHAAPQQFQPQHYHHHYDPPVQQYAYPQQPAQPQHDVETRAATLRSLPPPAARLHTFQGHAPPPAVPAWQVELEAEGLRQRPGLPLWFRTLIPAVALFGAMFFAGVILFVDPPATLSLETQPADAEVRLDGELVLGASPFNLENLGVGEHVLTVRKDGFLEHRRTFQISHGEHRRLPAIELTAAPEAIEDTAAGAAAAPESRAHGRATPASAKARLARSAPRESSSRALEDAAARSSDLVAPRPSAATPAQSAGPGLGMLRINTRPWTKVYVDGRLIGNTPQMGVPLPAGEHRVELVNDELDMRKTIQVTIEPDEIVTKIVNLVE